MADTIRELIIQDIKTQLGTLSDYTVYRGITQYQNADLPVIALLPELEESSREYGIQKSTATININAIQVMGDTNPSVLAEQMLGELIACIIGGRANISNIEDIRYTGGGSEDYPDAEEQTIMVQCNIEVDYETLIGDPYSQP